MPANSCPGVSGRYEGSSPSCPRMQFTTVSPMPQASTRTSTSPSPGVGVPTSTGSSGPPHSLIRSARMPATLSGHAGARHLRAARSREADDLAGDVPVGGAHRTAGVVDDVVDGAGTAEVDREQVVHLDARRDRDLEGMRHVDVRVHVGEDVTAHAVTLERLHVVGHLEGRPAEDAAVLVGGLVRRVVGQLVLEEDVFAVLADPDDVVLLEVLDEQPCRGDMVAVHHKAGVSGVDGPADRAGDAVVSTPDPQVVKDRVV